MRDQRVMAKDRDQQETLADLSPEESGWFSASLKHPEAKPEEVIEELREAIPIQMVHVAVAGGPLPASVHMHRQVRGRATSHLRSMPTRSPRGPPPIRAPVRSSVVPIPR